MERQKIVAVGRDGRILEQLEQLFGESAVDVQVVEDPRRALSLIAAFPLELVLVVRRSRGTVDSSRPQTALVYRGVLFAKTKAPAAALMTSS